uniref:Uncharacterized protein n=1 Tax=Rhizophora mucronata TaxID=61149 RepID=A0A2P2JE99_RHIMU
MISAPSFYGISNYTTLLPEDQCRGTLTMKLGACDVYGYSFLRNLQL